jgi:hypothetical protein
MLLPVLLKMSALHAGTGVGDSAHHLHMLGLAAPWTAPLALLLHTLGYLLVTGLIAFVVYQKLGLEFLQKSWVNLDLIWAVALIATAGFTLLIPT